MAHHPPGYGSTRERKTGGERRRGRKKGMRGGDGDETMRGEEMRGRGERHRKEMKSREERRTEEEREERKSKRN